MKRHCWLWFHQWGPWQEEFWGRVHTATHWFVMSRRKQAVTVWRVCERCGCEESFWTDRVVDEDRRAPTTEGDLAHAERAITPEGVTGVAGGARNG